MYMVVKLAIILLKLRICISINLVGEQYFNAMTKNWNILETIIYKVWRWKDQVLKA